MRICPNLRSADIAWRIAVLFALTSTSFAQDLPGPKQSPPKVPAPGMPMPRLPRIPVPGKRGPTSKPAEAPNTLRYVGSIHSISAESLELKRLDGKIIRFECVPDTEYLSGAEPVAVSDLKSGDEVEVQARKADGKLIADKVSRREKPRTAGEPPLPSQSDQPDHDRPVLRRGKPVERDAAEPASTAEDAFWSRAMDEAREYAGFLPNFICREMVTRFYSTSSKPSFRRLDTVTVDVAYVDGKEYYTNHRIGNRRASAIEAEATGTWTFGEYGSTVKEVLKGAARFRFLKDSKASGLEAKQYEVVVARQDSGWRIEYQSRVVFPPYKGSVWVDLNSGRVLRIELQSTSMPQDFAIEKAEWVVDFGYVALGDDYYLLPVFASNLACWRYKPDCSRNDIEFQNYRQFSAESFIYTTESNVEFEKPQKSGSGKK